MPDTGARLTVLNGPESGRELVIEEAVDNILIGSDVACRFHLACPGVSPIHARIWMDGDGVTVYDTHSPRGLFVNDDRVSGQTALENGDILWLGAPGEDESVMIQVRLPPPGTRRAAPEVAEPDVEQREAREDAEGSEALALESPAAEAATETSAPSTEASEVVEVVEEAPVVDVPPSSAFEIVAPDDAEATLLKTEAPAQDADATYVEASPQTAESLPEEAFAIVEPEDAEATLLGSAPVPEVELPLEGGDATVVDFGDREDAAPLQIPDAPVKFAIELPPAAPAPPAPFEDETTDASAPTPPVRPLVPPVKPTTPPAPKRPAGPARVAASPAPQTRPAPTPLPRPAPAAPIPRASSARTAAIGIALALGLGAAGFVAWQRWSSPNQLEPAVPVATLPAPPATRTPGALPPSPIALPAPSEVMPEPPVEEAVTIVTSSAPPTLPTSAPTARPSASPKPQPGGAPATPPPSTLSAEAARVQQTAQQVAALLGRADDAAAARDFAAAASLYDEVLKLDPSHARAGEGRAVAQAAAASLKKSFVPGRTTVTSGKASKGGLSGFDSEDVSVAKALDYSGRLDFEASPRNVKAGDSYAIKVFLTNDGKKGFKIGGVSATTAANGVRSGGPVSVATKDVEPGQRVLLTEAPGTWQAGTTTWSFEVVVTSSRNDTFRGTLTWK